MTPRHSGARRRRRRCPLRTSLAAGALCPKLCSTRDRPCSGTGRRPQGNVARPGRRRLYRERRPPRVCAGDSAVIGSIGVHPGARRAWRRSCRTGASICCCRSTAVCALPGPIAWRRSSGWREEKTVIGLRFQPGAASAWLRVPASDLVNQRLPLEAFWGSAASALADWVSEAETPGGVARRLETGLAQAPRGSCPTRWRRGPRLIRTNRQPEVIPGLRDRLGASERSEFGDSVTTRSVIGRRRSNASCAFSASWAARPRPRTGRAGEPRVRGRLRRTRRICPGKPETLPA